MRALLLTVLGEFVLPSGGCAWTSTLVEAQGLLDVGEGAARQAIARASKRGWLRSERAGQRVRWHLTEAAERLLQEGTKRIYSFGRAPGRWNGQWVLLVTTVPETRRDLRYRLRTRLRWAGFGALGQGQWISPKPERESEARSVLAELALDGSAFSFTARLGEVGELRKLVDQAWDLDEIEARYEASIAEASAMRPRTSAESFVAVTRLVHEWRRFPLVDPDLPPVLLPANWSGARAAALFHDLHERWRPRAEAWWTERCTAAEAR